MESVDWIDVVKSLMDYGLAIGVAMGVLYYTFRRLEPRIEKNSYDMQALKDAITAQTASVTALMETCAKAFEDNRRTIEILLNDRRNHQ